MRVLAKPLLLVLLALVVPIVPFVMLGPAFEERVEHSLQKDLTRPAVVGAVVGLLAVDLVLPVPSSVVTAVAGNALGVWLGTAAAWTGMTLGAIAGFGLARMMGRPLVERMSSADELARIDRAAERFGGLVIVLARPIPILAEASVLVLGATRMGWGDFLAKSLPSNLGIAAVYAVLGHLVELPVALAASLALPVAFAALARWFWPARSSNA